MSELTNIKQEEQKNDVQSQEQNINKQEQEQNIEQSNQEQPPVVDPNQDIKDINSQLKLINNQLNEKFQQLKSDVIELKKHLDTAVFNRIEINNQKIIEIKSQLVDASNKITQLERELEDKDMVYSKQKQARQKYFSLLRDKMKNESFYLNQEEIIHDLLTKNSSIQTKLTETLEKEKQTQEEAANLLAVFEEKKTMIQQLQNDLSQKINSNKNSINILNDKTKEIANLRNQLELLKNESEMKYQNIQKLKNQLKILNEKNKHLTSFINENSSFNINTNNNVNVNNTTLNNSTIHNASTSQIIRQHQLNQERIAEEMNSSGSDGLKDQSNLNENEENNMKEIDGLMKAILEE